MPWYKKLHYNSPVVLTYALICLVFLILNIITIGWFSKTFLVSYGHPSLLNPMTYVRGLLYIFGHSSVQHFAGNMLTFLLVGPIVEEKYGSKRLIEMIFITGILTAIVNGLFFSSGIIGASGIVFMLIMLSAFVNIKKDTIPISLVLVATIYLGSELYNGLFVHDNVSQLAHIAGGIVGLVFGLIYNRKN